MLHGSGDGMALRNRSGLGWAKEICVTAATRSDIDTFFWSRIIRRWKKTVSILRDGGNVYELMASDDIVCYYHKAMMTRSVSDSFPVLSS